MIPATKVEYASKRPIRERNTVRYRIAHLPLWITVFFLAPGPLIFDLFNSGFDWRMGAWLGLVLIGTAVAGTLGNLPGVEPRPYILKFTEDKPNPLYRRICYTFAWSAVISFAVLNLAGLVYAAIYGKWILMQIYRTAYFPVAGLVWVLGALGILPRVRPSTKGEGHERRYFYGSVWAVAVAQPILGVLWKVLPRSHTSDILKLIIFVATLAFMAMLAVLGQLPRTRVIVPGEDIVSD